MEKKKNVLKQTDFTIFGYVFLFTNILLAISSYWFSYKNFYLEILIASLIVVIGLLGLNIFLKISLFTTPLFYIYFLYGNYNFVFIFAIILILAIFIVQIIKTDLKIPWFIYSFIPLLILMHVLWFNILPFGFEDEYKLNFGNTKDQSPQSELYLTDPNRVLTPRQSYGDTTWREFRKDGTFYINFNTPVNLENKQVEVKIVYENPTGPLYVNQQLLYDPAWGSSITIGNMSDIYIYRAEEFNVVYPNMNLTNNTKIESIEDYLRTNFKQGVLMKDYTNNYKEIEKEMNAKYMQTISSVDFYDKYSSDHQTSQIYIRGPVKFYGIFDKSVYLSFLKQDLNLYNGSDSVNLLLKDFNGNIINNITIEDNDGIENRTTIASNWKRYYFIVPLNQSGIYNIEFQDPQISKDPDYVIANLTINSNKIIIDGPFQLWGPATLYNNNFENPIRVRYWWSGYEQLISLSDGSKIDLTVEDRGSWIDLNVSEKSSINFEKGKLILMPTYDLSLFNNTYIDTNLKEKVIITKSLDLKKENIDFINISGLNITGTAGTKISQVKIKIN